MARESATSAAWLTRDQAAEYAGVSTATIDRAIERRRLRAGRTFDGGLVRIKRTWVDAWLSPV
jgi:excisionase family DNA binding protein